MIRDFKINGKAYELKSENGIQRSVDVSEKSDKEINKLMRKSNDDTILIQGNDNHKYIFKADELNIKGKHGLPKSGEEISFVDTFHRKADSYFTKEVKIEGTVLKSRNKPEVLENIKEAIEKPFLGGIYGGIH